MIGQKNLNILYVSHVPASPPRSGAQARIHGLMTQLAQRHELTAITLIDNKLDAEECRRHMQAYCRKIALIPNPKAYEGLTKRRQQLLSLVSSQSFERRCVTVDALQRVLDTVLRTKKFDIVNLEFSFLGNCNLRQAPPGERPPRVVVDSHNIDYELARQYAKLGGLPRRLYAEVNWRKLRREELKTYRDSDGVYLCSAVDEQRLLDELPRVRTAVIPNAADIEYFQPRLTDPAPDGRTVVFFGSLSYFPNIDGIIYFIENIWPRIVNIHPDACLKIVGAQPPPALQAFAGRRISFTGFVPDLRPHLATAAALVVPLRLGGGTRLKIVEGMAMGKATVSTTLGAEGIDAISGRDLLIEDHPKAFADAVNRLLADPDLAMRIGRSARQLAVQHYSWSRAAQSLESFYHRVLCGS
jgi:glycosyltransferase involved in cell wall biosynthesis